MDPDTGIFIEKGHPLEGKSVKGKVLVFPTGKGSTVGSYVLYRMKKNGVAPIAIINEECEPIVAVGAIISDIPCVDKIALENIKTGSRVRIDGESIDDRIVIGMNLTILKVGGSVITDKFSDTAQDKPGEPDKDL